MRRTPITAALGALAAALIVLAPAAAQAQSSPVSELWREWAVLEQQWRAEKAEVEADHRRLRARRAAHREATGEAVGDAQKGDRR